MKSGQIRGSAVLAAQCAPLVTRRHAWPAGRPLSHEVLDEDPGTFRLHRRSSAHPPRISHGLSAAVPQIRRGNRGAAAQSRRSSEAGPVQQHHRCSNRSDALLLRRVSPSFVVAATQCASLRAACFMGVCEHPLCYWWPSRLRSRLSAAARSRSAQPPARWASPDQPDAKSEDCALSSAISGEANRRRFAAAHVRYAPRL